MSIDGFLDAKSIPKFQFQLLDEELIKCIKQLYIKSTGHQKIINQHKKQIQDRITIKQYIESLNQIKSNLNFPKQLQVLVPSTIKNKQYKNIENPVLAQSANLSNKFAIFTQIISILNSKLLNMQKRMQQSQQKTNRFVKQKTQSVEQQLKNFIKDYRNSFKQLNKNFEQTTNNYQNKVKQVQTNTLWKINECIKRLQDRPNIQMVKNSVSELQIKLTNQIKLANKVDNSSIQTVKLQQQMIKLDKKVSFSNIQLQKQIKSIHEKLQHQFISLQTYSNDRIDLTKRFQNNNVVQNQLIRKVKFLQIENQQNKKYKYSNDQQMKKFSQNINKLNQTVKKFSKSDQFAKILEKIDPHQLCRLSNIVKELDEKQKRTNNRMQILQNQIQAIRSKTQFWNIANSNPEENNKNISADIIQKIVKEQINNSDIKVKMAKFQHQIIDLFSLKEVINDILKKLAKINKDQDLNNLKYQIKGVQQYIKREILIVNNRINSLEVIVNGLNEAKKRPKSAMNKTDMISSLSTKKLVPVSCLSCHQSNNFLTERKGIFKSKLQK